MNANREKRKAMIEEYLRIKGWLEDTQVYTREEWNEMGKYEYGSTAEVNLTFDGGSFYSVVNCEFGNESLEKFTKFLGEIGCYYELGYSWMMNVYEN